MYRYSVYKEPFSPVKEPAMVIIFKRRVRSMEKIGCVLLDKLLLEPGMWAYEWPGKGGIDLEGHFFKFYGSLVIFGLEDPAFLQDHLYDLLMCPPD